MGESQDEGENSKIFKFLWIKSKFILLKSNYAQKEKQIPLLSIFYIDECG